MEKVKEEYNCVEMYLCPRCENEGASRGWYCDNCNPPQKVDFTIKENMERRPNFSKNIVNWKERKVCPYCYNQLVDKFHNSQSRRKK